MKAFATWLASLRWGENGELGPGMFSLYHIGWMILLVGLGIFPVFRARKPHDKKRDDRVILAADILLWVMEICKQLMYDVGYYGYLRVDILPLAFCSVPLYLGLVGALVRNEKVKELCYRFIAFYGIIGGIGDIVFPVSLETSFIYTSVHTMLWHSVLVLMSVYLLAARGYGKKFWEEMRAPAVLLCVLTLAAVVLNELVFFCYLNPKQTPVFSVDDMPGSYEYYQYGIRDGETEDYLMLSDSAEGLILTKSYQEAENTLITLAEGEEDRFYFGYIAADETERYFNVAEQDGKMVLTVADAPAHVWSFDYTGWHPAFTAELDGGLYCVDFSDGKIAVSAFDPQGGYPEGLFIKTTVEREGDSVNFFFVSNHSQTPVPVLTDIQNAVPYPVFIVIYTLLVFAGASVVWGATFGLRRIGKRKA